MASPNFSMASPNFATDAAFDIEKFSVIGKGNHKDERTVHPWADQLEHRKRDGTSWGRLRVLLPEGVFLSLPAIGPIVVLGHLGAMLVSVTETTSEDAVFHKSLSALGAALFYYGARWDIAIECEAAVKGNRFLLIGYGTTDEMVRAKTVVDAVAPRSVVMQEGV
ncbi:DUF1269 domain-containing protein [Paraburkholderia sp. DGU8]|uniref:DUF1269 domain-containing protein n=1 Tax=Paraburkholderia sp. DGU8 TaxID=3161997 RepID=UPI0034660B7B